MRLSVESLSAWRSIWSVWRPNNAQVCRVVVCLFVWLTTRYLAPDYKIPKFFTLFVRNGCPHCSRAMALLESKKMSYEAIPIEQKITTQTLWAVSGSNSTPQCFCDGKLIGKWSVFGSLYVSFDHCMLYIMSLHRWFRGTGEVCEGSWNSVKCLYGWLGGLFRIQWLVYTQ